MFNVGRVAMHRDRDTSSISPTVARGFKVQDPSSFVTIGLDVALTVNVTRETLNVECEVVG
jgi:hypothetical protein